MEVADEAGCSLTTKSRMGLLPHQQGCPTPAAEEESYALPDDVALVQPSVVPVPPVAVAVPVAVPRLLLLLLHRLCLL